MRKAAIAITATLALLGFVVTAPASNAEPAGPAAVTAPAVVTQGTDPSNWCAGVYPHYLYQTGYCFYTDVLCIMRGDTIIPAAQAAQAWNNYGGLKITYANNCVTAGYPPSRRMTITSYYSADGQCGKFSNQQQDEFGRWTNNPVIWINLYYGSCLIGSDTGMAHRTSAYIGTILGLDLTATTGMSSHVINMTAWSITNVPWANVYDSPAMCEVGVYGVDGCPNV